MGLTAGSDFFGEENVSLISFPCRDLNPMLSSSPSVQCGMEGNCAKRSTSVFTWSGTEGIGIAVIIAGHSTHIRNCLCSNANEVRVTILNCCSLAVNCQTLVWSACKVCNGSVLLSSRFRVIFISDTSYTKEIRYVSCRRLGVPSEPAWTGPESPPSIGVRAQDCPSRSESLY